MTEPGTGWASPGSEPTPPPYLAEPPPPGYGYGYGSVPPPGYAVPWAPTPGVVPLRPLGLGELLDGSMKIIRRYPKPTLGLAALIALVTTALNVVVVLTLDNTFAGFTSQADTSAPVDDSFSSDVGGLPALVVSYLGGLVLAGMLVAVVGRAVLGQKVGFAEAWATVRPRLLGLLGLALLTLLIVAGPIVVGVVAVVFGGPLLLLVLLPSIPLTVYLYTRLALGPATLVLEKAGVRTALRRSGVLVRGSWWRVFGILALTGLIGGVISSILAIPVVIAAAFVSAGSGDLTWTLIAVQVAGGLSSIIVAPFTSGVNALLYVDQRMRKEGLDVALQAAVTASPAP